MNISSKSKSFALLLILFGLVLRAQTPLSEVEKEELTSKVESLANQTKSLRAEFTQEKHLSVLDKAVKSKGVLLFATPDKIKWEYLAPFSHSSIFNGAQLTVIDGSQSKTIDLQSNKMFKSLYLLISESVRGNMFNEELFTITYLKFNDHYLVILEPRDKKFSRYIQRMEVTLDPATAEVLKLKLVEDAENYTQVAFTNRQRNLSIPAETFKM